MDGSAYAGKSKLQVLLGSALLEEVRGRSVIDFGCGEGHEALELAKVAAHVEGVDIQTDLLARARAQAEAEGLSSKCRFSIRASAPAEYVVSIDSFEHFNDPSAVLEEMHNLLVPNGKIIASFGPTWFHPYGAHMLSVFPWAHLVFSEKALLRWRSDLRSDGATRFREVTGGLNGMTIARFERIVAQSRFSLEWIETVPIRKLRSVHRRWNREFTTAIVRCRLARRN